MKTLEKKSIINPKEFIFCHRNPTVHTRKRQESSPEQTKPNETPHPSDRTEQVIDTVQKTIRRCTKKQTNKKIVLGDSHKKKKMCRSLETQLRPTPES